MWDLCGRYWAINGMSPKPNPVIQRLALPTAVGNTNMRIAQSQPVILWPIECQHISAAYLCSAKSVANVFKLCSRVREFHLNVFEDEQRIWWLGLRKTNKGLTKYIRLKQLLLNIHYRPLSTISSFPPSPQQWSYQNKIQEFKRSFSRSFIIN